MFFEAAEANVKANSILKWIKVRNCSYKPDITRDRPCLGEERGAGFVLFLIIKSWALRPHRFDLGLPGDSSNSATSDAYFILSSPSELLGRGRRSLKRHSRLWGNQIFVSQTLRMHTSISWEGKGSWMTLAGGSQITQQGPRFSQSYRRGMG